MPQIRLIGLLLFITSVVLGLAAAATRTTHVSISGLWLSKGEPDLIPDELSESTTLGNQQGLSSAHEDSASIPVAWPLLALGGLGLCLWFMQSPADAQQTRSQRGKRKRKHQPRGVHRSHHHGRRR